jgi:gliding motility-associated-like protein
LIAPGGFQDYLWFNPDFSKEFIDAQKYTISPPPPDGTKYAVVLFPFNGIGCVDTLYTVVNKIDANLIFKVADTVYGCVGTGIDLTAASVTAGSDNNLVFSYYDNASATGYLFEPKNILKSGTYYIQAVSPAGCINILPVNVVIANPSLIVHNPAPAVFPVTVDISSTFVHNNSYSYGYFTDSAATIPVDDYEHIAESGTYYIRAANPAGCTTTRHVNIVVVPPPPPVIKAPNTFTPNNDGINDYFFITVIGYGEFESLKIYNRYGQLVFETKSADNKWDGKYNGKPANPGTYYWVFDGANTYYHTKVTQSGFITLIR